jgi:MATE family multidrug resistance protein
MGAAGMWLGLIVGLTLASIFLSSRFINMSRKNKMVLKY